MSLKSYLILMVLATSACYLGLASVLFFFDPFTGGFLVQVFFYTSLFLALLGTFAILGLFSRLIFTKDKLVFKKVIISFRQGIWFSLLAIICLYLKKMDLLGWRNIIFLILAFSLLEIFFISYKIKPSLKV